PSTTASLALDPEESIWFDILFLLILIILLTTTRELAHDIPIIILFIQSAHHHYTHPIIIIYPKISLELPHIVQFNSSPLSPQRPSYYHHQPSLDNHITKNTGPI